MGAPTGPTLGAQGSRQAGPACAERGAFHSLINGNFHRSPFVRIVIPYLFLQQRNQEVVVSKPMQLKQLHTVMILALLLALLAPAFGAPGVQAQEATSAPPVLLGTTPAQSETWLGGPVRFMFDQAMSAAEILVSPTLAGETSVQGSEVIFSPADAVESGTRYRFTLASATAQSGAQLLATRQVTLVAAGPLAVAATQPADGSEETDPDGNITVIFNRPVVPLTGASEQADLPQPLTFAPAVGGQGRWISTSVYQFTPAAPLAGATTYEVTVAALTDVSGDAASEPYTFAFSTAAPTVLGATPAGIFVNPDAAVRVTFSQPMDPSSTEAAFSVTPINPAGESVAGATTWNITNTTLIFTPTAPLDYGTEYLVQVADTAQPASQQGTLRAAYESTFTVVPLPAVIDATILNGAEGVNPESELRIRFSAPVSETTLLQNIRITPLVTTTNVVSYTYSDYYENTNQNQTSIASDIPFGYGTHLTLNWYREAETTYTVTIGAGVTDQFGNSLAKPYELVFTTGDYQPLIQIDLDRFTHYSAYTTTVVGVRYRNLETVDAELFRLSLDDLYQLAGENQWQVWDNFEIPDSVDNLIWSKSAETDGDPNVINRVGFKLVDADGNPLPPGIYMLEVRDPVSVAASSNPNWPAKQRAVIVLSNNNITFKRGSQGESVAWVTDLRNGQPVAGAEVTFHRRFEELATATTDADGLARASLSLPAADQYIPVFAASGQPGDANFAVVSSDWASGIEPWSFNLNSYGTSEQAVINLYTERPIYQPGQTVYWKGIVRLLQADEWTLPQAGEAFQLRINDTLGNVVLERTYTADEFGTIHGEFTLAPDAPTGWYGINTEYRQGEATVAYGSANFVVAAYVKPEFQIDVQSEQPEYVQGDTIRVNVQASYFSGGPLVAAPVEWRLIANTYSFTWADTSDGAPEGRFYSFDPFDPDQAAYNPYENSYLGLVQEGKGTTDAQGRFTIELPADLGASLASQSWSLDVIITSPTSQQVYNNVTFPVHRGEYYIGLSPTSYVVQAGEQAQVNVVTVTPEGKRYPDADLDVVVYEFRWNSVYERAEDGNFYWQTTAERTPVYTTTVSTDANGDGALAFTPEKGGQYQVTGQGTDAAGNTIRSAAFVWAADSGYVAWPRENNDRIELVADKRLYAPGDTAKILVPNPFTGTVQALITLERGGVMDARVIELTGSGQTVEVPISSEMIPNVFVGVVIVKGVDESNPFVATRVGYVGLAVDTSEKELSIDIQPSADTVEPGDTVTYTLTIRDSAGNPAPDVSTSVALVDKAVLALGAGYLDTRSLVDIFYYQRPLGVTTGSLIVINKDRISAQLAEGGKGGGGGGDGGGPEVREEFPDTAFWRADFVTDENGVIEFAVTLPDNLTTWVLTAKGVNNATQVGQADNEIVATKPLQVRPALPRFLVAGDRAVIGGMVVNFSEAAIEDITFTIDAAGGVLEAETTEETFFLQHPGDYVFYGYPFLVDATAQSVVVTMTAAAGELSDGVRIEIPVLRYQTPETVGTSGVVEAAGVTEAVHVPAGATDDGELRITLDPSLAAGLLDGLDYLEHFPYECTEQTVSRFLPNLFTVRALDVAGNPDDELAARLDAQVEIGVQSLISRQNPDGGWGFWPQQESSPFITAYVLWGLWNANQMDYTVDPNVLTRATGYLDTQFQAPDQVTSDWQLNEMAFVHYVLAQMNAADPGRMSTLYDVRERLEPYGRAFLAMAMHKLDAGDARVQTLVDDLLGAAVVTATGAFWQDATLDFQTMSSDVRTTAIVLDALLQIAPDQPLLPNAVRWLMTVRENGRWRTTQENAWSIIALTDWLEQTGELAADFDWSVTLDDSELGSGRFDDPRAQEELRVAITDLLADQANLLHFTRSDEPGALYYTTFLSYNIPAQDVQPLDRGMVIERQFSVNGEPVSEVNVGDVVSVTVTIVAPNDLYHVLVEAPVPAGAEPLDPLLPTGFQYDQMGQPVLRPLNAGEGGWYAWTPASLDYRADKVAMFATFLPAGSYQYTFEMRAAFAGEYNVLPAHGEMMYFPEVWGRSSGEVFTINN
jgi:uncharacterized protein YfaS (alpha-2-macroglobulin family)